MEELKKTLKELAEKYGIDVVRRETLLILRRETLGAAAKKMHVMPHSFSAETLKAIKGRKN